LAVLIRGEARGMARTVRVKAQVLAVCADGRSACLDIFSPPAGDSDVSSQGDRDRALPSTQTAGSLL